MGLATGSTRTPVPERSKSVRYMADEMHELMKQMLSDKGV